MRLTATRSFRYLGRQLKAGDDFDAKPMDAKAYKAIRYATDAPPPKPAPKAEPKPASTEPQPEPQPEPDTSVEPMKTTPEMPPPKPLAANRYPTRRLKADD